jgi:hypothetical protein
MIALYSGNKLDVLNRKKLRSGEKRVNRDKAEEYQDWHARAPWVRNPGGGDID